MIGRFFFFHNTLQYSWKNTYILYSLSLTIIGNYNWKMEFLNNYMMLFINLIGRHLRFQAKYTQSIIAASYEDKSNLDIRYEVSPCFVYTEQFQILNDTWKATNDTWYKHHTWQKWHKVHVVAYILKVGQYNSCDKYIIFRWLTTRQQCWSQNVGYLVTIQW